MTLTLKKQLTLLCATAILGGTFQLKQNAQAQYDPTFRTRKSVKEPRLTLTRDEAARQFLALLETFSGRSPSVTKPDAAIWSSFSRSSENDSLEALLPALARQINEPEQKVKTQSEGDKTAIVVVETSPTLTSRPLVMVQEGDGWGVDVVETYARWNGLEGAAKTAAVAALKTNLDEKKIPRAARYANRT